jgi:hypothetical protein
MNEPIFSQDKRGHRGGMGRDRGRDLDGAQGSHDGQPGTWRAYWPSAPPPTRSTVGYDLSLRTSNRKGDAVLPRRARGCLRDIRRQDREFERASRDAFLLAQAHHEARQLGIERCGA